MSYQSYFRFRTLIFLVLACVIIAGQFSGSTQETPASPCGPQSPPPPALKSSQAVHLVEYLRGLRGLNSGHTLSGQQVWTPCEMGRKAREFIEPLRQQTGVVPAIFGALYPDWPDVFCTMQKADNLIISYAKKDGVIPLITWSANNPWNGNAYSDLNVPDFCEVNRPGTAAYAAFDAQLELIRASLMRMRKRGVTVLFRPLQEMNGDWFWWGNRNPEAFKKLWWRIYQRLAIDSGLDNLVWVYSAAAPTNVPVESLGAYYPGDAYVDVIGLSVYSDTMEAGDISSLLAIDKPFGFSEVGPAFWQNSGGYDGQVFVDTVRAAYPEVVFTMHWHSWVGAQMAIIDNPNPDAVLLDPWMVNASALPRW